MEGDGKGWVGFVGNGVDGVKRERACGRGEEKESELPELNQRPLDLQSNALPTELSSVCFQRKPLLHNTCDYSLLPYQASLHTINSLHFSLHPHSFVHPSLWYGTLSISHATRLFCWPQF